MLKKAFLPHVINGWTGGGANWVLSMADATMNIGIFNDDRATFDNGVADWRAQVPAAIYMAGDTNALPQLAGMPISPPGTIYERSTTSAATLKNYWHNPTRFISGLEGETLRDINHMAMGFGAMIDGAETARLQGVDLYGAEKNRIVTAMELNTGYIHAAVKGGQNPPPNWVGAARSTPPTVPGRSPGRSATTTSPTGWAWRCRTPPSCSPIWCGPRAGGPRCSWTTRP